MEATAMVSEGMSFFYDDVGDLLEANRFADGGGDMDDGGGDF